MLLKIVYAIFASLSFFFMAGSDKKSIAYNSRKEGNGEGISLHDLSDFNGKCSFIQPVI